MVCGDEEEDDEAKVYNSRLLYFIPFSQKFLCFFGVFVRRRNKSCCCFCYEFSNLLSRRYCCTHYIASFYKENEEKLLAKRPVSLCCLLACLKISKTVYLDKQILCEALRIT